MVVVAADTAVELLAARVLAIFAEPLRAPTGA
jgi:hypothetical protein